MLKEQSCPSTRITTTTTTTTKTTTTTTTTRGRGLFGWFCWLGWSWLASLALAGHKSLFGVHKAATNPEKGGLPNINPPTYVFRTTKNLRAIPIKKLVAINRSIENLRKTNHLSTNGAACQPKRPAQNCPSFSVQFDQSCEKTHRQKYKVRCRADLCI